VIFFILAVALHDLVGYFFQNNFHPSPHPSKGFHPPTPPLPSKISLGLSVEIAEILYTPQTVEIAEILYTDWFKIKQNVITSPELFRL